MIPEVLYEDNHILCVKKPPNMPVQADDSGDEDVLTACKRYIKAKYAKPGDVYLGLVHRLDRPVGGVMALARTSKAAARLTEQIQSGCWSKRYYAVVCGSAEGEKELYCKLLWDEKARMASVGEGGKEARLVYKALEQKDGLTLLDVALLTGRHHQIRAQLANEGLPIWGDARYNAASRPGQQIALWAYRLELIHPTLKTPVTFECMPPKEFPWSGFEL